MDPQREQQLAQAAQQLAGAVYQFLQQAAAACSSLNAALFAAQATGTLPMHLPLIPVPPAALPLPDMFSTPVKQTPPKSLSFPQLDSTPLWSPMAMFQASLQQHALPTGGLTAAANGPTRSTARAGAGARRGGQQSPPKQPPPLFDARQQAQPAGTLHHWKSEVSANMAALSPPPNGLGGGLPPAAAVDPISPRAAALMAACQEAEQAPPARLVRLTSNLSSAAEAPAGEAAGQGVQPLAKQRSDLAELALMAEEESRAAAAAAAAASAVAKAANVAAADGGGASTAAVKPQVAENASPCQAAAAVAEPASAAVAHQQAQAGQAAAKRSAEEGGSDEQAAGKRQRSSRNASNPVAAEQVAAQLLKQEEAAAAQA